ncbi:MAG: HXXEE domain-containing protein [Chitinophagaceae bacterium]|jgi:hypothetical protein|nr:HXXEE domain-containing protein [Chitinophagaceae bacterium]
MNYINKYWATFGGIFATGILITAFSFDKEIQHIETLIWFHLAILLLHQFEEYSFPGKFKEFYNANIFNKNPITKFPLNDRGVLIVNIVLAWTMYIVASIVGTKMIYLTFGLIGITILNGIMHTVMFVKLKKYNPGLITGAFAFIPFGFYLFKRLEAYVTINNILSGLLVFVVGTILIPTSIYLTSKKHTRHEL